MVQEWNYTPEYFVDREPELTGFGKLLLPETPQAVMIVTGLQYMGKSWLLDRMGDACCKGTGQPAGAEAKPIPVVKIDFGSALGQHDIQDTLSLLRLIRDGLGQPSYFWPFNSTVNWFTTGGSPALSQALGDLTQALASLDFARLRMLSDYLNVRYDDLEGGEVGTLTQKSHGLVMVLQRQCRLPDLLDRLKASFPDRDWSSEEQAVQAALAAGPELPPAGGAAVEDMGADLSVDDGRDKAEASINDAFFQCLQALQAAVKPVVLLLDTVESAPDWAKAWIGKELFPRLRTGNLPNASAILAVPQAAALGDLPPGDWLVERELPGFGLEEIQKLFEARHVPIEPKKLPEYADLSGGKPGVLDLMADNLMAKKQAEDPFFK